MGSGLEGLGPRVRVVALEHRLVVVPQCELRASEHVVGIALPGVVHVMRRRGHDQGEHIDGSDVASRLLTQRGEHVAAALQHVCGVVAVVVGHVAVARLELGEEGEQG